MAQDEKDSLDQEPVEHEYDTFLREVARARASNLPSALPDFLEPGDTLLSGRFAIQSKLGRGGMGVVYSALDRERDRLVALKILTRAEPSGIHRLKNEFRSLSGVVHPNLVGPDELFVEGGAWFFTMDLVTGQDFLSWVRPDNRLDEARLRNSARQLVEGIEAIHRAGKLHRDLKPSNVLVTPQGRVVILDFGLASDQHEGVIGQTLGHDTVSGTPCYMAPEQAAAQPALPSSDWYAFGVMLFEALTGKPPFEGRQHEVLMRKQQQEAPRPSSLDQSIPSDLEQLCIGLLQRDPQARPRWQDIIEVLGSVAEPADASLSQDAIPFVGRIAELEALHEAFKATDEGQPVAMLVHGASGVGKTTLVERFLDGLRRQAKVVVLTGRCYERESVPFKACDSLVDALSRHLRRLPAERAGTLLPMNVHAIAQLFPALQRLDLIGKLKQRHRLPPDPDELRRVAFEAFKELLARIASQEPLVLFVDDLQWSDVDGAKLLSSVLSRPNPPSLLLIGAYRSEEVETSVGLSILIKRIDEFEAAEVREIELGELSEEESQKLARDLLPDSIQDRAAQIAREAQGSPFFITELSRFASTARDPAEQVGLQDAIKRRLAQLTDGERETLEAICVSARPIKRSLLRAVTNRDDAATALRRLQADHLVRYISLGTSSKIRAYHDRIRDAVVAGMDETHLKSWHGKLARGLETSNDPDLIALTEHLLGAGDDLKAGLTAARAADHAAETLAFENAARLYRIALDSNSGDRESQRKLQRALATALAHAGRGAEAAPVFVQAAEGASPEEQQELRQLAAHNWIMTGHMTEGLRELDAPLRAVGLKLRSRPAASVFDLLADRLWIKRHGLRFRERQVNEVSRRQLLELRACSTAAGGLYWADPLQAVAFSARFLRLALESGLAKYIVLALCGEASWRSSAGVRTRSVVNDYLNLAQHLSQSVQDPALWARVHSARGIVAHFWGEIAQAHEFLKRAEQVLVEECDGASSHLSIIRNMLGGTYAFLGRWGELVEQWDTWMADAQERNDVHVLASQSTGHGGALRYLIVDQPDRARKQVATGLMLWPRKSFDLMRFAASLSESNIEGYGGNYHRAFEIVDDFVRRLSRSPLRRIQAVRVQATYTLARTTLNLASSATHRDPVLKIARKHAEQLAKERFPLAEPYALHINGGIALLKGNQQNAVKCLREAVAAFERCQCRHLEAAAKRQLGRLLGGDEGSALVAQAEEGMKQEGVVRPDRIAAMLGCGFSG